MRTRLEMKGIWRAVVAAAALSIPAGASLDAQENPQHRAWNEPIAPFRIIGNIHYVGSSELGAYLIPTPDGHILIDTGLPETLPQILSNVGRLGYRAEDIRILLNTQAHFDHIGGHARLRRLTGARIMLSEGDVPLAGRGGLDDFAFGDTVPYDPVTPDRTLHDGDAVRLGGTTLTARITPGHTQGCTTWTTTAEEDGQTYDVAILCSVSAPGYRLVDNPDYPSIQSDFRNSFTTLKNMQPDVFLASHGSFFGLKEKRERLLAGASPNPFIAPDEWTRHIERQEAAFEEALTKQQGE